MAGATLISDDLITRYYGENVLHMATTNEDPAMVKYLLDAGVNFQVSNEFVIFYFH